MTGTDEAEVGGKGPGARDARERQREEAPKEVDRDECVGRREGVCF